MNQVGEKRHIIVLLFWLLDMYSGKLKKYKIIDYNPGSYLQSYFLIDFFRHKYNQLVWEEYILTESSY